MSVMNYDPNLNLCGRMTVQRVRLTLAAWEYRKQIEVDVRGNVTGFALMDAACDVAYEELVGDGDYAEVVLVAGEDTLTCGDDEDHREDWLKELVIALPVLLGC